MALDKHVTALNLTIADRDAEITRLKGQVALQEHEVETLTLQLMEITNSSDWMLLQEFKRVRLRFAPSGSLRERILQLGMRGLRLWRREGFLAMLRRAANKFLKQGQTFAKHIRPDMSWEEFQAQVLFARHLYKGVFIQEPVLDWNVPLYQRPQHMATALGKLGYLVIYKTPGTFDIVQGFREVTENVWLTNLSQVKIENAVFSVYSSTAYGADQILTGELTQDDIFVYEYIDHISTLINGENTKKLLDLKKFAFQSADFVVTSARLLEDEASQALGRDKVLSIPNGVDVLHYRNPNHESTRLPTSFTNFHQKYSTLVGYFGAIAPWLWYDMLDGLLESRPDLGFVFIGPDYYNGFARLPQRKNLLYLGPVEYKVLPAYARLFDICLIPFAPGEIARTTSPLKLFEYFALEKPVVVTSFMDECVVYDEVFSGDSSNSIATAIDMAIKVKDNPDYKARLALLAERNSWEARAKQYEVIFSLTAKNV